MIESPMRMDNPHTLLIIGAGNAAYSALKQKAQRYPDVTQCICLDDDPEKIGTHCDEVPIQGPINECLARMHQIHRALIAMPSVAKWRIREIYKMLQTQTTIDIIPSTARIVENELHPSDIRPISPVDIIGRDYYPLDVASCRNDYQGNRIMITGAGGSIGTELSCQLLWFAPEALILLDHSEDHLHSVYTHLRTLQREGIGSSTLLQPLVVDLRQPHEIAFALETTQPTFLIHTAAYKHVHLMERNPYQAMTNNILGTYNLLHNACQLRIPRFIYTSTDKVVYPRGIYGRSKLIAEWIALNFSTEIEGMVVRFGNVLGSRGSLLPLLEKNIPKRKIYISTPKARRYFMSASEASSLILRTLSAGNSQHLYMLDMGASVSILELAKEVIDYHGLRPYEDVAIEITGLAPEEKEEEELAYPHETLEATPIPRVLRIEGTRLPSTQELQLHIESCMALSKEKNDLDNRARVLINSFVQHYAVP